MSIEALAMAGIDYTECNIKLEELEKDGLEQPPQYLLDMQNFGNEVEKMGGDHVLVGNGNGEWMKARMLEWVKAVVAVNEKVITNFKRWDNLYTIAFLKNKS
ncbi:hypothetical protein ACB092_02G226700 [Castanea dentata]